ncbi:MAG TPA: stage V sporulation protein AC [Clostridiaceae bacterium]|nr:stage V sporulation protein AC [Clostridiaceae bacterium]
MYNIMTKKEYEKYAEKIAPKSNIVRNTARAFVVGGLICVVGQIITNFLKSKGYDMDDTSNLTALIMILIGIIFTGLNVYDELGRFAGAGSIVPITGFANSIVSPAMEFKSEGFIMGVGAKMFVIAGPVLVYGISASVVIGIIYYLLNF